MRMFKVKHNKRYCCIVRKPRKELSEGEIIKVIYTDGNEVILRVNGGERINTCHKSTCQGPKMCLCYESKPSSCEYCLAGAGKYFISVDSIMEYL